MTSLSGQMMTVALVSILAGISTFSYSALVRGESLAIAFMSGVVATLATAAFLFFGVQVGVYLAGIMYGSMAGAFFVCAFMAFGLQGSLAMLEEIGSVLAGKDYSWQQKAAAAAMFLSLLLTLSASSRLLNSEGAIKVPQNALAKAKPTQGHPNQLMYDLGDEGKVLFRKDFGAQSHSVGGPFSGQGKINHYNIELQTSRGQTIKSFHIAPDGKCGFTTW